MIDKVRCAPEYAYDHRWWVVTEFFGELFFWGAYDSREKANRIADRMGKIVLENEKV